MTTIGAWIRFHRKKLGLSQDDVADAVGLHQTTVSHWERGRMDIDRHQIVAICKLFGLGDDECLVAMRLPVSLDETEQSSQEAA